MEIIFLDTSALAKRYVSEKGSEWISRLCEPDTAGLIYIAEITTVEITSAITRRLNSGSLSTNEAEIALSAFDFHLLSDYFVLEINSNLLSEASLLVRLHGLRSYDAVQLAVAGNFNRRQIEMNLPVVTFVSADNELLAAAKSEGLLIENPSNY